MKRSVFTNNDIKNIICNCFADNSEQILLVDENGKQTKKDLAEYLNIEFYVWKNRVVTVDGQDVGVDAWLNSLNYSMDKSFALIETTNCEVVASEDIDSATVTGRITFLVQSNKVSNLDYFVMKTRNAFLGKKQVLQNSFGNKLNAYVNIGVLLYDDEPETVQVGETIQVSLNFTINYLTEAVSYNDLEVSLSLDVELATATFHILPYIKATYQNIFQGQALTSQITPNRIGIVNTGVSQANTIAFYGFNDSPIALALTERFFEIGAYAIKDLGASSPSFEIQGSQEVNFPVWLKIKYKGKEYVYKDAISNMEIVISNSDFAIMSITLKGGAKA